MPDSDGDRTIAITREVSRSIARCELSHIDRTPIDLDRARAQHRAYEQCLRAMGCHIERLPEVPELPDSVFVEDVAVVLDELAIVTRPGAPSRRPEVAAVADALGHHRKLVQLRAPATLDGGDVIVSGKTIFIGRSARSNDAAIEQLADHTAAHGYRVVPVDFSDCLHLKSAATCVAPETILANTRWVSPRAFDAHRVIEIDPGEPSAANAVQAGGQLLHASSFPRTRERLLAHGLEVLTVDASELAKAEGALTCCSLIFRKHEETHDE